MNMKDDGVVRKMCEETILKDLLEKIKPIRLKYKKLEEKQFRYFNIFSILDIECKEVKLHSRFICELLNPKAEHKQKEKFLKEFLSILKEEKELANFFSDDELSTISVERERDNIDILISSKDKAIIIENKIHADYGDNQLSGYKNTVKKQGYKEENIKTVYLTLNGDKVPKNESDETVRKETVLLSYKKHIVRWLEACIEKVASIPRVKETLQQYLELIKKLTGRALNKEETMEVKKLFLDNKDYMKAFANAQEGFEKAAQEVREKFWKELKKRFKNEYKNIEDNGDMWYSVPICEIEGKDTISFAIEKEDNDDNFGFYGFILYKKDTQGKQSTKTLREKIIKDMKQVLGESEQKPTEIWPWWNFYYLDCSKLSLTDFTKDEVCDLHFDKKARDKFVDEKFQEAKKLIDTLRKSEEFKKYNWLVQKRK